MNLSNAKYLAKEGFRSFWVNGLMSAASTMIVAASLLIFGIYILFTMNINYIGQQLMSKYEIQIYLNDISQDRTNTIEKELKSYEHVKSVTYTSKEEALNEFRKSLGDSSSMLDGLDNDNPVPASFKITLDSLENSQSVVDKISKIKDIYKVKNDKSIIDRILEITSIVRNASLWLMILLSIIAVFIISNTIKITVFARRREINIMKYIGATNNFISWPFIIEGIIIGFIGAMISLLIVTQAYNYIYPQISSSLGENIKTYMTHEVIGHLLIWFVGIGCILGAAGSAISLRRHLQV